MIDMPLHEVFHVTSDAGRYVAIPVFPPAKRDLAFIVKQDVEVQDMIDALQKADTLVRSVEWFDTYIGKGVEEGKKSVAFHFEIGAADRTLESVQVDAVMNRLKEIATESFNAIVRT